MAVDPTSPFTGGAILGDRIRMQSHHADPGCTFAVWRREDFWGIGVDDGGYCFRGRASGKTRLLIETVGVGQDEVDIVRLADVTVVVLVPGLGDDVQSIKAGILEIADIFVVNKSDREGADRVEREIRAMQSLGGHHEGVGAAGSGTVATTGEGTARVLAEGPALFADFFTDFLAAFLAGVFLTAAPLAAFFAGDFLAAFLLTAFFAAFLARDFFAAFLAGTFFRTSPTVVAAVPIAVLMALATSDATASPIPTVAPAFSTIVVSAIFSLRRLCVHTQSRIVEIYRVTRPKLLIHPPLLPLMPSRRAQLFPCSGRAAGPFPSVVTMG